MESGLRLCPGEDTGCELTPSRGRFHRERITQDIFGERQLHILAKDEIGNVSMRPVGTGPFCFKSWHRATGLELEKNTDYFEAGLPKLDGVTLPIIPETAARVAAIDLGAMDVLPAGGPRARGGLPPPGIDPLKLAPDSSPAGGSDPGPLCDLLWPGPDRHARLIEIARAY
jgi:ABC-type transport system substrate-binding protein